MRAAVTALLVAGAAALVAGSAAAHGTGGHTGLVSTVSGIEPPVPGLVVEVLGAHERISVRNWTPDPVVLFDESGRQLVRLAPGESEAWADPRISWVGPPPEEDGLVRNWRIPGEVGGTPFEIAGYLGYAAPAAAQDGGTGLPAWGIALAAVGGALVLAAALALPLFRREGEGDTREAAAREP